MTDPFESFSDGLNAPGEYSFAIAASDTNDLATIPRAIYVGSGGDIKMQLVHDAAPVVWSSVPTGSLLSVRPRRIYATGTSASNLVALY